MAKAFAEFQAKQAASSAKTVGELYEAWMMTLQTEARLRAARAHRMYIQKVVVHMNDERFKLADLPWAECTHERMLAWVAALRTAKTSREESLSIPYRNNVRLSLGTCFNYHLKIGSITRSPLTGIPLEKGRNRMREGYFDPESFEKFAPHCHPLLEDILRTILRCGGLRVNELRSLRKDQIDHGSREFVVPNKGGGTKRVIITDDIYEMLLVRAKASRGEFLFPNPADPKGRPIGYSTLSQWMRKAREKAGIKLVGEWPVIHMARHGYAVNALEEGALPTDVAEQLGHKDTSQLLNRYGRTRGKARERIRAIMNRSRLGSTEPAPAKVYECETCGKACPGMREAVACMDSHVAAGESEAAPARAVIPMAKFDKQGRTSR